VPRFKLTLEYAGTRYSGWQVQRNARTVQGVVMDAVREVTGRDRFEVYGSGRTDAGVHALAQVAHLDVATRLAAEDLRDRLNAVLPSDVVVLEAAVVSHRFHARRDAVARRYRYQLTTRRTAFAKPYAWWVREPLDLAAMADGANAFVGLHDFRSFTDDAAEEKSTRVLVEDVAIREAEPFVLISIEGSHFLWKMVRRMVGVLVEVGRGGLVPTDVPRLLRTHSPRPAALTAPAAGLFLERVYYPGESREAEAASPLPAPPQRHRPSRS